MCGIFGYLGKRSDAQSVVLQGLKQLEYRGYDSWGVAFLPANTSSELRVEKHTGKIGDAELSSEEASSFALGHTRWATHGGVTVANAHPHLNTEKSIAVVHNGIIENFAELRQELQDKGYVFTSKTDTEVVAHLLDENLKSLDFLRAAQKTFLQVTGLNAFVVMHTPTQEMIEYRKGSPLVFGKSDEEILVASDAVALSAYTNTVYFLEDTDLLYCRADGAQLYEGESLRLKDYAWQTLEFSAEDTSMGKYASFLEKEIFEQPGVLHALAESSSVQIKKYAQNLHQHMVLVGCGTAYIAALLGSYFFALICQRKSTVHSGSELPAFLETLTPEDFVTFLSQSGETIDIVQHLPFLAENNVAFGTLVNRVGSTLERQAEHKVLLGAGPEQSVLATKSYTAKLAMLFLLAHELHGTLEQGIRELRAAAAAVEKVLEQESLDLALQELAEKLARTPDLFVIGRGVSYPLALEAALKIKEVTYIHTEGMAAGELKHGTIALIEKSTPCIVFAPDDDTYESIISSAMEVKARGAYLIGIGSTTHTVFDTFIPVENVGLLSVLPSIVVIQLLAYKIALQLGNDPDKPRNLAKSVTVK